MKLFDYEIDLLREKKDLFLKEMRVYSKESITPKVYFIVNETRNEVIYIGSTKWDAYNRLYAHVYESFEIVDIFYRQGHVRKQSNDYKKTRAFCDMIYGSHKCKIVIFSEYDSIEVAELVEKALIYHSGSREFTFNLVNSNSIRKVSNISTLKIKKNKRDVKNLKTTNIQ